MVNNFGSATLLNTIVADNQAIGAGGDVEGTFISQGFNLIGDTTDSSGWNSNDLQNMNPQLGPLGYYGGPTQTMPLLQFSPAINAGTFAGLPPTSAAFIVSPPTLAPLRISPLGWRSTRPPTGRSARWTCAGPWASPAVQFNPATIFFDPTVFSTPQTILLTHGPITLSNSATITITNQGAAQVTVSGNHASGVFQIDLGVSATLLGLTITAGLAGSGGGIDNAGTLTLTDCTISGNSAYPSIFSTRRPAAAGCTTLARPH